MKLHRAADLPQRISDHLWFLFRPHRDEAKHNLKLTNVERWETGKVEEGESWGDKITNKCGTKRGTVNYYLSPGSHTWVDGISKSVQKSRASLHRVFKSGGSPGSLGLLFRSFSVQFLHLNIFRAVFRNLSINKIPNSTDEPLLLFSYNWLIKHMCHLFPFL